MFLADSDRYIRTIVSIKLIAALNLPPVTTPKNAPIKARPVAVIPMQYKMNMTLLAVSTTTATSFTASGHFRSSRLNVELSSLLRILVGSKWNRPVEFEQEVTFFLGCEVSLAMGEGV